MKLRYFLLCIVFGFCVQPFFVEAQYPSEYVKITAKNGDGLYQVFENYHIPINSCNLDYFYSLNNFDANDHLIIGKKYKLPIYIYYYNGESIRSTINIKDWNKAKRIQQYNREMKDKSYKVGAYEDSKELWVPYYELQCKSTNKPSNTTSTGKSLGKKRFYIFGKDYRDITITSHALKGCIFYIVSGHGGPDPGAICEGCDSHKHNYCEDEYAYDVSLRLARNLIKNGATVYIITRDENDGIRSGKYLPCDNDEICWLNKRIPRNPKLRLEQRSGAVNEIYKRQKSVGSTYQRAIMLHIDSRDKNQRADMFFYYYPGTKKARSLAMNLREHIRSKYAKHQPGRGYSGTVSGRDLHMLRETKPVSLYIELGNIANKKDQTRFLLESNRQAVADWLCEGIIKDYQKQR